MNQLELTALEVAKEYYSEEYTHYLEVNGVEDCEESAENFIQDVEQDLNNSEQWEL